MGVSHVILSKAPEGLILLLTLTKSIRSHPIYNKNINTTNVDVYLQLAFNILHCDFNI